MRFGRVEGVVVPVAQGDEVRLRLTVFLETAGAFEVVRDELVPVLRAIVDGGDLAWHADQFTQETIAVDLAETGWEVIGVGDQPVPETGELQRSAPYTVRNRSPGRS